MDNPSRNTAIQLYKSGKVIRARELLTDCVRNNPKDVTAWLWLVETLSDNKERLAALRVCLKHNPEESRVKQALFLLSRQESEHDEKPLLTPVQEPDLPQTEEVDVSESEISQAEEEPVSQFSDSSINPLSQPANEPLVETVSQIPGIPAAVDEISEEYLAEQNQEELSVASENLDSTQMVILPSASVAGKGENEKTQSKASGKAEKKQRRKKHKTPFFVNLFFIALFIFLLFLLVFAAWWIGSGRDPGAILSVFGLAPVKSPGIVAAITDTPQPTLKPTFPATFTLQSEPTITPTPTPMVDPELVIKLQAGEPIQELSGLPPIVAVVPSKNWIAFQPRTGGLQVWDINTRKKIQELMLTGSMQGLAFSEDGQYLVVVQMDGMLQVWDTQTWENLLTIPLEITTSTLMLSQLAFTPAQDAILIGYCSSVENACVDTSHLVNIDRSNGEIRYTLNGYDRFAATENDSMLVWKHNQSPAELRQVSIQSGSSLGSLVGTSLLAQDGYSIAVYSDDSTLIAAASNDGVVRIWDANTGNLVSEWVSAVPNPNQILFHPNDTRMVVGNAQSLAQVWDIASSLLVMDFNLLADYGTLYWQSTGEVHSIRAVQPNISIWDVLSMQSLENFIDENGKISNIILLPTVNQFVAVTDTGAITVWQSQVLK